MDNSESQYSGDFSYFNRLNGEFYTAWLDQRNKDYFGWYDTLVRIYIEVVSLVDEINDDNLRKELMDKYNNATNEMNAYIKKNNNNHNSQSGELFNSLVVFDIAVRKPLRRLGIDLKLRNPLENAYRS